MQRGTRFAFTAFVALVSAGLLNAAWLRAQAASPGRSNAADDPVKTLTERLDLEQYKANIKGLTQFGDRTQGTDRNRAAIDWIEAHLKSDGCSNTERVAYVYAPRPAAARGAGASPAAPNTARGAVPRAAAPSPAQRGATPADASSRKRAGVGGSTMFGVAKAPNVDPNAQPDPTLRALNAQATTPGPREEVFCTKIGTTHPDEMYIVAAHMDGRGYGEAANDDGSGTALVMQLARIFAGPDVQTERSIRFILWNNEESGFEGARAYVDQRKDLQGKEDPPGSHRFPEPRWLGMVQHDMMLFDHGAPRADGTVSREQRPEADVNIEFQDTSKMAAQSLALAWAFKAANEKYATDYPAAVGNHMTNTDSTPFEDILPSISMRENERGAQIGAGWDPQWHQPTDLYATYSDKDFRLGLNAAQTTLAAIAQLTGATIKK
jgi:hypothetical protein